MSTMIDATPSTKTQHGQEGGPMSDIDELDRLHAAAWDGQGALFLDAANVAPLVRELIDLTNSEDDIAEDRSRDPAERSGARGARTALQNLSTRLLAAVALP
jgi:hypothetical protein